MSNSALITQRLRKILPPNRSHLSEPELKHLTKIVVSVGRGLGCPVFDGKIPSEDWYGAYVKKNPKIVLITDAACFSEDTHGYVVKYKVGKRKSRDVFCYLVFISQMIKQPFLRCFTIAHELGHVLLHGQILLPQMMIARRSQSWHNSPNKLALMMEVEANVYAMYSLIPTKLVETVIDQLKPELHLEAIQRVLQYIYSSCIDMQLVEERLYLHWLTHDTQGLTMTESNMKKPEWLSEGCPTWIRNGLPMMKDQRKRNKFKATKSLVSKPQVIEILAELERQGIVSGPHAKEILVRIRWFG